MSEPAETPPPTKPEPAPAASDPGKAEPGKAEPAKVDERDPAELMRARGRSPELAAVLAWLIPGLGHIYAGFALKGVVSLVLLLGMWIAGIALSRGEAVSLHSEEGHPYAFVAQVGVGLPTGLALLYWKDKLPGFPAPTPDERRSRLTDKDWIARLPDQDTGLLFTMVAGLLNLLLVYDALQGVPGAIARRAEEARTRRRVEALRAELAGKGEAKP